MKKKILNLVTFVVFNTAVYGQDTTVYNEIIEFYHALDMTRGNCFLSIPSKSFDQASFCKNKRNTTICDMFKLFQLREIKISKETILQTDNTVKLSDQLLTSTYNELITFSNKEIDYSFKLDSLSKAFSKNPDSKATEQLMMMVINSLKGSSVKGKRDIATKKELAILSVFEHESFLMILYYLFDSLIPEEAPLQYELILK